MEEGFIHTEEKSRRCCVEDRIVSIPSRAIAILHQDDLKNRMNILFFKSSLIKPSYSSNHPGAKHPILQIVLVQIILFFKSSWQRIEVILSPKQQQQPLPSLLYKSFFYDSHLLENLASKRQGQKYQWRAWQ